jgi:hypothetical protein
MSSAETVRALMTAVLLVIPLLIPVLTNAGDVAWLGPDRKQWPDTEFRKTKNDFAAMLLVTPDTDWQRKWNTPPNTVPRFREVSRLKIGQELVILTFFVNPKTDEHKRAQVRCSIKVTRPNKTVAVDQRGISCMNGELKGDPNNIRLAPTVIKFVGEAADPLGEWVVEVEVEDVLRATKLPLRARFTLLARG